MTSGNNKETKYSFKASNNKKIDNKFANIYQDLSDKETKIGENLLSKIHKTRVEEQPPVERVTVKEVDSKSAEINSKKRRQAAQNQLRVATSKSSPINDVERNTVTDTQESLKRLKEEKNAQKQSVESPFEDTMVLESVGHRTIEEEIEYIRKKAREKADIDKSDVKIYKKYSDFESATEKKVDINLVKQQNLLDKEDNTAVQSTRNNDVVENEINKKAIDNDETIEFSPVSMKEEIKRIQRLQRDRNEEPKSRTKRNKKSKIKKEDNINLPQTRNRRGEVYEKNSSNKSEKIKQYKKMALGAIIVFLIFIFGSALMDKFMNNADQKPDKVVKVDSKKDEDKNKENKKDEEQVKNPEEEIEKTVSKTKEELDKKISQIQGNFTAKEKRELDYIVKNINSYPDDLLEKLIRNSEVIDYVYSYKDRESYNQRPLEGITSSYDVEGQVPLFLQWDRRWGYRLYGKEMMGLAGCGPTSLAMVVNYFDKGAKTNPYEVAKYSYENGYVSPKNFTSWKLFENGLKKYGLQSRDVVPVEAKMKRALDNGDLLIVSVKPGIFTDRGHIIVIKGYTRNGDFLVNDPNSIKNTTRSWSFDVLKDQIRKIWAVNKINKTENTTSNKTNKNEEQDPSIIQDIDS